MGRMSEYIEYLTVPIHPDKKQIKHHYTHITIDEDLKKVRLKHRRELRKLSDTPLFD